ncbi:MAG: hypothetical protein IJQ29_03725 [Synergistaceae bacterium]|nr:hypothetical protein [Synergistaceae bacterium]
MTDIQIVNRALVLIGVEPIGALNDHSKTARIMSGLLPQTKRTVLNEFPFTFSLRIEPLSATSGSVAGYSNVFKKPTDCLNVTRVYSGDSFHAPVEFRIVGDRIAANVTSGSVEYTIYIDNVDTWPQHIQECLATRLASDAAVSLTGNPNLSTALLQKYMTLANHAAQTSVNEENISPIRMSDYLQTRTQGS